MEPITHTNSISKLKQSTAPILQGSGSGGNGSGLGQVPLQSTHEHGPVTFYIQQLKCFTQLEPYKSTAIDSSIKTIKSKGYYPVLN